MTAKILHPKGLGELYRRLDADTAEWIKKEEEIWAGQKLESALTHFLFAHVLVIKSSPSFSHISEEDLKKLLVSTYLMGFCWCKHSSEVQHIYDEVVSKWGFAPMPSDKKIG